MANGSGILLIEDNHTVAKMVSTKLSKEFSLTIDMAVSFAQAEEKLKTKAGEYFLVISGLVLPDATKGEIADLVLDTGIPLIVLTATYDEEVRSKLISRRVFDYIIVKNTDYVEDLIYSVRHAIMHSRMKVLIVDDSKFQRKLLREVLSSQLFEILEADDGTKAVKVVEENPDIRIVLTDYDMPDMDGFILMTELRKKHTKENMAIVVISGESDQEIVPRFLKFGANDYIKKPFDREELLCRINLNVDNLAMVENLRRLAHIDIETGAFNKKYFYQVGELVHSNAMRNSFNISVAMIELDEFQQLADIYGYNGRIQLVKAMLDEFESILKRGTDVMVRFADNRIGVITDNQEPDNVFQLYNKIRERIANKTFLIGKDEAQVTVTIGACTRLYETLDQMVVQANEVLEEAIGRGRNIVWLD